MSAKDEVRHAIRSLEGTIRLLSTGENGMALDELSDAVRYIGRAKGVIERMPAVRNAAAQHRAYMAGGRDRRRKTRRRVTRRRGRR